MRGARARRRWRRAINVSEVDVSPSTVIALNGVDDDFAQQRLQRGAAIGASVKT
jgi:hypothetical protein